MPSAVKQAASPVRTAPWPARHLIGEEERDAAMAVFDRAIESGNAFGYNGEEEEAYCREFVEHMGGEGYADAVNSGTAALYVALKALEIEPYAEVVVGAITDPGGMMPIPLNNLVPVIADVTPDAFNTGPREIEACVTPLTRAVVVPHIFGEPADMEGILSVARRHGLVVIEDCSQCHGATLNGRPMGTFGDIAVFSTMFSKQHCTGGQGGVVYTRDEALYWRARRAADRGKPFNLPEGATNAVGALNCNLDELGCAIGRAQLAKLPGIVRRCRAAANGLRDGLRGRGVRSVSVPDLLPGAEGSYWNLRMRFHPESAPCNRDAFLTAVAEEESRPPVDGTYHANTPHTRDWFKQRRVFGASGLPWSSPLYKGDPNRDFPCPNAAAAGETNFRLNINERWTQREVADMVEIFARVEERLSSQS